VLCRPGLLADVASVDCLGGPEVDHKLQSCRKLQGEIGRFRKLQFLDVSRRSYGAILPVLVGWKHSKKTAEQDGAAPEDDMAQRKSLK
jgi:hypothetical protein